MIIQPIKLYSNKYNLISNPNTQIGYKMPITSPNDILELSFTGAFENSTTPVHLEQALEYSTVHCANCGVKMLSKERHEELANEAMNAKNAKELIYIIYKNREYVPHRYEQIFENIKNIPNYKEISIPELRDKLSEIAIEDKRNKVHEAKNFMFQYAKNFPKEKQKKAIHTVKKLHTIQNYVYQKEYIEQFIKDLELNNEEAKEVRFKTLKNILIADSYYRVFNSSQLKEIPQEEYGAFIIKRLFYPSVNSVIPILKNPTCGDTPNNKVMVCKSCLTNQSKSIFWKYYNSRDFKNNLRRYLSDISYLMGSNKIDASNDYVVAFVSITNKVSKGDISFTPDEVKAIRNVGRISARHEGFAPIEQTEVDIPCAECGSTMLPHKKRIKIENEMKKCNTPYEYAQILKKYGKYIGKHQKTLAKIFLNIVDKNPNISNEDFIKEFSNQEYYYTKNAFKKAFRHFYDERAYMVANHSIEQLKNYDKFADKIEEYISEGKFNNFEVSSMLRECMKGIDFKNHPVRPIFLLVRELKNIAYKHQCTGLGSNKTFEDKDGVYTILFNLFKYNVATADHLVAEHKGGEGDKNNLIGLCKTCNRLKAQKKVKNWISENKYTIENFKRQMHVIDKMTKSGKLQGYDDWAKNIAQKIYELTEGWYDFREEFN